MPSCPCCGQPIADEPKTAAQLREWCAENGHQVSADLAVSTEVAASICEVSPLTMRNWRSLNIGPPHYRRGSVRYRLADLAAYLDSRRSER
jgi:hypothetical protein